MRQTGGEIVLGVVEEWIQQEMCAVSSAKKTKTENEKNETLNSPSVAVLAQALREPLIQHAYLGLWDS